jgi:hypothetical protein
LRHEKRSDTLHHGPSDTLPSDTLHHGPAFSWRIEQATFLKCISKDSQKHLKIFSKAFSQKRESLDTALP